MRVNMSLHFLRRDFLPDKCAVVCLGQRRTIAVGKHLLVCRRSRITTTRRARNRNLDLRRTPIDRTLFRILSFHFSYTSAISPDAPILQGSYKVKSAPCRSYLTPPVTTTHMHTEKHNQRLKTTLSSTPIPQTP